MNSLLIVEDDEAYRESLRKRLLGRYIVFGVSTLAEAIKVFGTCIFNAVLLDTGLPDSHQYETVSRMKRKHPQCAIVVLSGNEDPGIVRKCITDSASSYLIKGRDDQNVETLVSAIDTAMANNAISQKVEQVRKAIENGTEI